ncbi:MAG: hypothetical protein GF330_07310 [Candidatus Eisenbacteria bacterium]|nr:hypothetical protein [Candidatus Eisenbacteria bacterium]
MPSRTGLRIFGGLVAGEAMGDMGGHMQTGAGLCFGLGVQASRKVQIGAALSFHLHSSDNLMAENCYTDVEDGVVSTVLAYIHVAAKPQRDTFYFRGALGYLGYDWKHADSANATSFVYGPGVGMQHDLGSTVLFYDLTYYFAEDLDEYHSEGECYAWWQYGSYPTSPGRISQGWLEVRVGISGPA